MTISRIAGLFLAVAVSVLTPGSATAGWDEGVAAYDRGDYHAAFREFMPLAVAGDPSAQFNIGLMYDRGAGRTSELCRGGALVSHGRRPGPRDSAIQPRPAVRPRRGRAPELRRGGCAGIAWPRTRASRVAQFNLGVLYNFGLGVPENHAEAARWYRLAADQGNAECADQPGPAVRPRPGRAGEPRRGGALVSHGRGPGQRVSAEQPRRSCTTAARACLRTTPRRRAGIARAAEQGYADAQNNLGGCIPRQGRVRIRRGGAVVSPCRRPGCT